MVTPSDFARLDLRIGTIISVEKVEDTSKLYKILADIGNPQPIQILSGIARIYPEDKLIGKQIVILVNMEPKVIKNLQSQGMLLAAVSENQDISLLIPDKKIPPGTKVY